MTAKKSCATNRRTAPQVSSMCGRCNARAATHQRDRRGRPARSTGCCACAASTTNCCSTASPRARTPRPTWMRWRGASPISTLALPASPAASAIRQACSPGRVPISRRSARQWRQISARLERARVRAHRPRSPCAAPGPRARGPWRPAPGQHRPSSTASRCPSTRSSSTRRCAMATPWATPPSSSWICGATACARSPALRQRLCRAAAATTRIGPAALLRRLPRHTVRARWQRFAPRRGGRGARPANRELTQLRRPRPLLLLTVGLSGSGEHRGAQTAAGAGRRCALLRRRRKRLAELAATARPSASQQTAQLYSPPMTQRTYARA